MNKCTSKYIAKKAKREFQIKCYMSLEEECIAPGGGESRKKDSWRRYYGEMGLERILLAEMLWE